MVKKEMKEIVSEYNRKLKEIDEIRKHHQERVAIQNEMSYYLVMIAASGYPDAQPKSFAFLKSQCDEIRTREDKIAKEIDEADKELAFIKRLIGPLED